ncbi:hypothetical protein N658DRAFT_255961 [Parathielavia hyrcaniae]|uniref:Uncharacterized protein n=1 Tax=Parathielavia hyrcaniae TaxID=113614 RepID=A0AAN6PWG0_9PEZI|nr:hypothetical protein N658DRAFT_255961 [Parathielavia hyrcaniae]
MWQVGRLRARVTTCRDPITRLLLVRSGLPVARTMNAFALQGVANPPFATLIGAAAERSRLSRLVDHSHVTGTELALHSVPHSSHAPCPHPYTKPQPAREEPVLSCVRTTTPWKNPLGQQVCGWNFTTGRHHPSLSSIPLVCLFWRGRQEIEQPGSRRC